MTSQKASFATRLSRLLRLCRWLYRTGRNLGSLDGSNERQREEALVTLGRGALAALDIELETDTLQSSRKGTLVVANHVSWLDIFAMSAVCPSSFIAKQEISTWPVLGKMGKNAGTVFINRESRRDIEPINQAMGAALRSGRNVSFFPEARTSSGENVLPFKAALFQSALDASAPVQVAALRYYDGEGRRSTVPSYADVNLAVSLWRIVSMKQIRIRLDFAPPIMPEDYAGKDRYALKDMAESFVRAKVAE
ncbi:1-acylglycerol-3-phosphate O-acyltransferase [Neisseria animalis]|uniref:1-acyl-sn-glycerol-3-phosphate acyltransferase n=1 Tax=Neisseria animalis TaxID=492 RepID=A0A5P3MRC0_NEIAN|nr:1-acylglycerol-3-phosphate O-acyltransferase [Neisseria animalis]QEY23331.1 1-acylglycerol-3-phosphate O-acyltransferase [Neisseria animalis]ROW33180.1 1-acylglycerol-3-phosphate O-acyltransferase [Neisseria animalis]VEE08696.1 1-acyl-SN-glycerol-3-phosphate acyltransferase [Neisseria animalis]